jgi:hypothetical protein
MVVAPAVAGKTRTAKIAVALPLTEESSLRTRDRLSLKSHFSSACRSASRRDADLRVDRCKFLIAPSRNPA